MSGVGERTGMVLKWPVSIDADAQEIGGGEVVLVAMQGPTLCVWTFERPGPEVTRHVGVAGTGHPLTSVGSHLGSVIDGAFVWHVFEVAQ